MRFAAVRLGLVALVLSALSCGPAFADLKAYNAAVTRGDFAGASDQIQSTWAGLDKARDDIFIIGREFGWTAMLAGKPVLARDVVMSLSGSSAVDDTPELTAVLLAWANFKISADTANREKLFEALRTRTQKTQKDLISVRASQDLFRSEWVRDDMKGAAEAAQIGHKVVAELDGDMVDILYTMRRFEAVSRFVQKPDRSDYAMISALADEIDGRLKNETDPKKRDGLITALAHTLAWQGVEEEVLRLRGRSLAGFERDSDDRDTTAWFPVSGDPSVPVCRIRMDLNGKRPEYPAKAQSKRLPGYAIYVFELGENGALASGRVLGSAPHEAFNETIEEVMPAWRWKMADGQLEATCRRPDKLVVHFMFQFN